MWFRTSGHVSLGTVSIDGGCTGFRWPARFLDRARIRFVGLNTVYDMAFLEESVKRGLFMAAVFVVAATWGLGCSDETGPEDARPTRVSLSRTHVSLKDGESTTLTATVYDQDDRPISGAAVTWSSSNPEVATVADGTVTGQRPGTTEITATAGDASAKAVIEVTPVATSIQMVSGDQQEGWMDTPLANSLVVRVLDRYGNGVGGVPVAFVVTAGGGFVQPPNAATNADGYAATTWVLGRASLTQTVEARAEGLSGSPVSFTAKVPTEPGTIAIGDTILGMIATEGEVDTFTFTGAAGQEVNFFFQTVSRWGGSDPLYVVLYESYGTPEQHWLRDILARPSTELDHYRTGRFTLSGNVTYAIVVSSLSERGIGPYRFQVYPIDRQPESTEPTVTVGDTISGESIDRNGDIDTYTFTGTEGQVLSVFIQPLGATGSIDVTVHGRFGTPSLPKIVSYRRVEGNASDWYGTPWFTVPADGTYTIAIDGNLVETAGEYRFIVFPTDGRPESIASTVAVGDTIDGESIDMIGDVDEFTFTGTAGQEINVLFQPLGESDSLVLGVYEHYRTSNQRLLGQVRAAAASDLEKNATGRIVLPADGTYTVVINSNPAEGVGAYRFLISPIDRRPESLPSTVAIGDTIDGESIYPKGDIDEFTFVGEAGQQVDIYVQSLACCELIRFEVYDRYGTAEQTLLGRVFALQADSLERYAISGLTLPRDGQYTILVAGNMPDFVGPYRFHIRPRT